MKTKLPMPTLAAAIVLVCAATSASPQQSTAAGTMPPAGDMALARALLEQLIEIDTTDTERGDNTRAAQVLADTLLEAGFPPEDVQVLVPPDFPTKGNLVARLRGSDPEAEPILLLAHLDVVEALPEDWSPDIPPFEFQERDGYFYGRGTADDKDECAIHTANLIRLRREGFVPEFDFPVMLNEVTEEFFDRSADLVGGETGEAMRRIVDDPDAAAARAVLSRQASYNARLRTTCVATLVDGGHAENALPQLARANVNCRLLPGHDPDEVEETLRRLAAPFGVEVERRRVATPSPPSPLTGEVLGAIERITEEMWPGVPVLPVMSSGATDGLYLRNAGIPVYGVSGIFGDMDDVRAHGRDERIRIDHFHEGQEFLYRLVKALAAAD